jgi:hypothetical protein
MVMINIEKRHLYLLSAIVVLFVGVGLVISGAVNQNLPWHPAAQTDIGASRSLADVIDSNGKVKCSEIGQVSGTDGNFCNDASGATEPDAGDFTGGGKIYYVSGTNCAASIWGTATSSGSGCSAVGGVTINCQSGSTKHKVGEIDGHTYAIEGYFLCIKD